MNTVLIAPDLFSSEGGIARILRLYLKALCEIAGPNDRVSLVTLNDQTLESADLRRYSNGRLANWAACGRKKSRFIKETRRLSASADLVVCGHVAQLSVAWALNKLRRKKFRYALVAHGIEVWRPFSWLEKAALRGAARIWCVSEFTRRELLRNCPRLDNTVVLPNALDPNLPMVEPTETPADLDILTVSRLDSGDAYKGVDHLIQALPLIHHQIPAARLRVVGRGDDLARLQSLSRQLRVANAVTFLGYVDDAALMRELASCRLFALPSQREGFGLVYVEALAHGKPCIGARDGGTPEVITPETGMLVNYGDVPGIANACLDALRRTWDADACRARAADFSYSHFRDRLVAPLPLSA